MERIFYKGRHPVILLAETERTVFFRAAAQLLAQRGPINNLLLATDQTGTVMRDAQQESSFNYSAYGFEPDLSSSKCRVGFNGEVYDRTFQGYLLGGRRAYIPSRPGFNSPDVFNMQGQELNWMGYCSGDPVNYSDPSGRTRAPSTTGSPSLKTLAKIAAQRDNRVLTQMHYTLDTDFIHTLGGGDLVQATLTAPKSMVENVTKSLIPKEYDNFFLKHPELSKYKLPISGERVLSLKYYAEDYSDLYSVTVKGLGNWFKKTKVVPLGITTGHAKDLETLLRPYARRIHNIQEAYRSGPVTEQHSLDRRKLWVDIANDDALDSYTYGVSYQISQIRRNSSF
ncbi:RHS repeat-associated core domain-containing protein [Pseudomonas sp. NPDC089407]|uniref:RHS repeat-associated core domain-containing protein n=1 Tax=Pseudomonas sp. NPDC089407 TaxID=3364464 RepID=UPI00384B9495